MKHLLSILAALCFLAAPAAAQTMKALSYNTTNGGVVAPAIAFTNQVSVLGVNIAPNGMIQYNGNDIYDMSANSFVSAVNFDNPSATRTNLGFSTNLNTLWTATNASNARTAIGLGNTNSPSFASVTANFYGYLYGMANEAETLIENRDEDAALFQDKDNSLLMSTEGWYVANTTGFRSAIGLPLAALTNTSNVTIMRALGGSTNTNEPYSGTVALTNTNVLTFSNGVLLKIQ